MRVLHGLISAVDVVGRDAIHVGGHALDGTVTVSLYTAACVYKLEGRDVKRMRKWT